MMRLYALAILGLFLTSCASEPPAPPPPLPPTLVQLQIDCGNDVNLGGDGVASPIMLRIYELRESSSFKAADFFALFNDDKAALGGDLAHKSELLLKPGETKTLTLQPDANIQSLGLFATFRQLDNAQWRASMDITPHQTQLVTIKLDRNQLKLDLQH